MAIIIPSKNIYDKQNPKVIDNRIDKIEIISQKALLEKSVETVVNQEKINVPLEEYDTNFNFSVSAIADKFLLMYRENIAIAAIKSQLLRNGNNGIIQYNIKKTFGNKLITRIYGNESSKIVALGIKSKGFKDVSLSTGEGLYPVLEENGKLIFDIRDSIVYQDDGVYDSSSSPHNITQNSNYTEDFSNVENSIEYNAFFASQNSVQAKANSEINTIFNVTDQSTDFKVEFSRPIYIEKYSGGATKTSPSQSEFYDYLANKDKARTVVCDYESFRTTSFDVTLYGDLLTFDLGEELLIVGNQNGEKQISFSSNELIQPTNVIKNNGTEENAVLHNFGKTLEHYKNGKETATLLCSISDYYDDSGEKQISIDQDDRMTFKIGDEVIPMNMGADGKDNSMSRYKDGTPKVFRVVGTNIIYDGAVWQEIYLQEV